jgi:thiamine-phosphate pyrophosphorylase
MTASDAAPRGLYLITPDEADTARLLARVAAVLPSATWLQYRNKQADATLRETQASALLALCRTAGVPLIVNDDAALAQRIGAAGAHLGEDDGDIAAARAARAGRHRRRLLLRRCGAGPARVAAGASYVAFGAFFPSRTKANTRHATTDLLAATAELGVPRVAIGGLSPDNAGTVVAAGADLLAVISAVFDAADPAAEARAFLRLFDRRQRRSDRAGHTSARHGRGEGLTGPMPVPPHRLDHCRAAASGAAPAGIPDTGPARAPMKDGA